MGRLGRRFFLMVQYCYSSGSAGPRCGALIAFQTLFAPFSGLVRLVTANLETPAGDDVKAPKPQAAAPAAPSQDPAAPAEGQTSVFDPPDPKLAKPGYTKRLPNGETVHYFPKMPCLRYGHALVEDFFWGGWGVL